MADKHSLNFDVRELKLGSTFTNNKASQYHTIKYDFKPASVDVNKMATVDVGTNHQVTVTVPHLDGAGVPQTVFKGNQRPYAKECVLIIDRDTGEITLERLSSNIQVKKTRQESNQKPRPLTPVTSEFTNTTQRSTSRTRVATNRRSHTNTGTQQTIPQQHRFNNNQKTPPTMVRSPQRVKTSPPQAAPWSGGGNSTLASLPMIGLDDAPAAAPSHNGYPTHGTHSNHGSHTNHASHMNHGNHTNHANHMNHGSHTNHGNHMNHGSHTNHASHANQASHTNHANLTNHGHSSIGHGSLDRIDRPDRYSVPERSNERPVPSQLPSLSQSLTQPPQQQQQPAPQQDDSSSSSSGESGSSSDSDSDSDDNDSSGAHQSVSNGNNTLNPALPCDVLKDDLCLSESGSDSDD